MLRSLTDGHETVDVDGRTLREAIDQLEAKHPGVKAHLLQGDALQPGLAVAVGGSVSVQGLRQRLAADDEVHFLPAIGGG